MRILVYEFFSGGGLAGRKVPASLAREGSAMLTALLSDLAVIRGHQIVTAVDPRFSLALPPGVPAAIVESFRKAFDAMIRDPEFLAQITERSIPFSPMGGEVLGKAIADTVAAVPPSARADLVKTYKSVLASMRKSP